MKSKNIDILPTKLPNNILLILAFLFNIYETERSSKKSKIKLIIKTKSKYIFKTITNKIIKKRNQEYCRFQFNFTILTPV